MLFSEIWRNGISAYSDSERVTGKPEVIGSDSQFLVADKPAKIITFISA